MTNDMIVGRGNFNRKDQLLVNVELLRQEELAQRRKLRIQQVRLQSKNIANKVLRDVQSEKTRQIQLIQTKKDDSFKKWQARKLFEINLKYKENISRLGSGYRDAETLPDPEKEISKLSKKNSDVAQIRGKKAFDHLKTEQKTSFSHQEKLVEQREKIKKLEGLRSALISSLPPPKNKRRTVQKLPCQSQRRNDPEDSDESFSMKDPIPVISELCIMEPPTDRKSEKKSCHFSRKTASCIECPNSALVEVYDRSNPCRFSQRQPFSVRVERTSPELQANAREAAALEEKVEAKKQLKKENQEEMQQKRGKKALAKEMVRRDYDRLVSRLDGLAREERIVRGSAPPPMPVDMFMDERRCALRAQKRQRNMDSAFEGIFHGNEEVKIKDFSSVEEDTHPPSVMVEQVDLPEQWLHMRQHMPKSPETPPPKLNVCTHDKEIKSVSDSGLAAKDCTSSSDTSFNKAKRSTDKLEDPEARKEPHEDVIEQDDASIPTKETKGKNDAPEEMLVMDSSSTEALIDSTIEDAGEEHYCVGDTEQSTQVTEEMEASLDKNVTNDVPLSLALEKVILQHTAKENLSPIQEEDEHDNADRLSDTRTRQISITKIETCTQTVDIVSPPHIESGPCIHSKEISGIIVETEDSSTSSQSSHIKIEEVRVLLRFNEDSPKEASLEEEIQVPCAAVHKHRKKRTGSLEQYKKNKEATLDDKRSMATAMVTPDVAPIAVKEKPKVDSPGSPVDTAPKPERKKRREKKDHQKRKKADLPLPSSESSYLSPPSHLDVSGASKAKALLEEIRAQRKRLEEWGGLKERKDDKPSAQLEKYVKRLLSMTRESIAELSVSDVSTPSIHFTSPRPDIVKPVDERKAKTQSEEETEEKNLVSEPKKVQQEMAHIPYPTKLSDEAVTSPKFQEITRDHSFDKKPKSPLEAELSVKSLSQISTSSSSSSLYSLPEMKVPERLSSPPLPPPPSPEYEQLSDLHSRRISQLGAKLMEVREVQRKILSLSSSSESDIQKSSSSSFSFSSKISSSSSEKSSISKKSDSYESKEDSGPRKSWDLSDISGTSKDSEDISFLGNILLEPLRISEPEKLSKNLQENIIARRKSGCKSGPPPTPLKGVRWSVFDNQIPHELSTITEVDSKLISTTSIRESRKEKDSVVSLSSFRPKLPFDSIPKAKSPEVNYPKKATVQSPVESLGPWKIGNDKSAHTISPEGEKSPPPIEMNEPTLEIIEEPVNITPEPLLENITSDVAVNSPSSSLEDDASYSSQYPENIDDALRMLGISPSIFKHPDSPPVTEARSPPPIETVLADEAAQQSPLTTSTLLFSEVKAQFKDVNVLEPVKDIGLRDQQQGSFTNKDVPHSSQSFSIRKSLFDSKESRTPVHLLIHSTPVHSVSTGTSSSSSDSHHKNISGFPFLGESAPSSISGNGTPIGADWRTIDDNDSITSKKGEDKCEDMHFYG